MEITHIGHSCFKIKTKNASIVIDPYDPKIGYKFPKQKADILLTTHDHYDHAYLEGVSEYKIHIDGPGEYEVNEAFIYGIPTYHDEKNGKERQNNIIYLIEAEGFTLLHLGDLGHELEKETMQKISNVDVLMIPVGGKYTIDAEIAAKVISSLEPGIVIPMHYSTKDLTGIQGLSELSEFLEEMGVENGIKKMDRLKISTRADIPEESTVYVLDQEH